MINYCSNRTYFTTIYNYRHYVLLNGPKVLVGRGFKKFSKCKRLGYVTKIVLEIFHLTESY